MSDRSNEAGGMSRRNVLAAGIAAATVVAGGSASAASASATKFVPNKTTFAEGLDMLKRVTGGRYAGMIVTSQDEGIAEMLETLQVTNIPSGFTKFHLPVYFEGGPGAQFFVSIGAPEADVPRHSHDEGDGLRYIVAGSILYEDKELKAGDWMFIPKGAPYAMKVGKMGATMLYCYQCCCA